MIICNVSYSKTAKKQKHFVKKEFLKALTVSNKNQNHDSDSKPFKVNFKVTSMSWHIPPHPLNATKRFPEITGWRGAVMKALELASYSAAVLQPPLTFRTICTTSDPGLTPHWHRGAESLSSGMSLTISFTSPILDPANSREKNRKLAGYL